MYEVVPIYGPPSVQPLVESLIDSTLLRQLIINIFLSRDLKFSAKGLALIKMVMVVMIIVIVVVMVGVAMVMRMVMSCVALAACKANTTIGETLYKSNGKAYIKLALHEFSSTLEI